MTLMDDEPLYCQTIDEAIPTASDTRDLDRLKLIVTDMLHEQAEQLVGVMWKMRRAVRGAPPLVGAFAALAVAESLLLDNGTQVSGRLLDQYRRFAVDLAERIARP
jgi:hypothetical protein